MRAARLLLLLGLTGAAPAIAQAPQFSAEEKAKLERGEVLLKVTDGKNEGISGRAAARVVAPPDKVWDVVNDCAHFKDFMPRTVDSKVLQEGRHCRVEVHMPFPFSNLWSETKVQQIYLDGGGRRRAWSLVEGTYHSLTGSWTVWPWESGGALVVYNLDASPDVPIPNAVLKSAQESTLPDMITAVRKRSGDVTFSSKD